MNNRTKYVISRISFFLFPFILHTQYAPKASKGLPQAHALVFYVFRISTTLPSSWCDWPAILYTIRDIYNVFLSVDSEMCKAGVSQNNGFVKQLQTVLHGEVKPSAFYKFDNYFVFRRPCLSLVITQCCIHELYLQGKLQQPAVDLAKTFERRKCNHREAIPGDECLTSVVGQTRCYHNIHTPCSYSQTGDKNKHRYVVATQSHPLRVKLRSVPATPIVHVNRSVMVLEPPSDITLRAKALVSTFACISKLLHLCTIQNEEHNLHAASSDLALVGSDAQPEQAKKKRKGPKGPNPLSVKKKKPVETPKSQTQESKQASANPVLVGTKRKAEDSGDEEDTEDKVPMPNEAKRKKRRRRHRITAADSESQKEVVNT